MTLQRKKEVGIVAFTTVYSLLFFAAAALFFNQYQADQAGNAAITIILLIGALFWVAFNAVTLAVIAHPGSGATLIGIQAIAVAVAGLLQIPSVVGALLFAAALAAARRSLLREINNRILYKTWLVFWRGVQTIMIALIVAGISLAWPLVDRTLREEGIQLEENQVEAIIGPVEPFLKNILPGYQSGQSLDDIIELQFQQQVDQLPPGVEIPPFQQELIRQQISASLQQSFTGQESLPSVVTGILNQQLGNLTQRSPWLLALIVILVVFLTLRALIPLASWPAIAVIALLVRFSQYIGLILLSRSQATIERLHL